MVYPSKIIGEQHLNDLNNHLVKVQEARHEIGLLHQAVGGQEDKVKELADLEAKILKFKSVYFPGR